VSSAPSSPSPSPAVPVPAPAPPAPPAVQPAVQPILTSDLVTWSRFRQWAGNLLDQVR
jgi:hypothetical protein